MVSQKLKYMILTSVLEGILVILDTLYVCTDGDDYELRQILMGVWQYMASHPLVNMDLSDHPLCWKWYNWLKIWVSYQRTNADKNLENKWEVFSLYFMYNSWLSNINVKLYWHHVTRMNPEHIALFLHCFRLSEIFH